MSGAKQARLVFSRCGRRGVSLVASLAVLAGALGVASGSAASPVGSGSARPMETGDGVVSLAAVPQCRAYVADWGDDSVSVIDTATDTVSGTIGTIGGIDAMGVAVSPDGATLYVHNDDSPASVLVIDTATGVLTDTVTVGRTLGREGVAVTPDGAAVYVTNEGDDSVSVIDTATNTVTATIPVGRDPIGVAVTPDGATVYVIDAAADSVSVIATASNTVTATIPVGRDPIRVAVDPSGTLAYVTNRNDNNVSVIATASNTVVGTIPVGRAPWGVAVAPDDSAVYVANLSDDTVSVIAPSSFAVLATIPVGLRPIGVAFSPDGATAYVPNYFGSSVSVIDTATYSVVETISVGISSGAVAFGPCSAPGRPRAPRAAVTGTGTVEATVVGASGGAAPTSFEVAALPGRRSCAVSGSSGSCVIRNLDVRGVYRVAAVASNGAGSSPPSGASVSVTPGPGDPLQADTQFGDVSASVYYARGVDMLFQHGITTGNGSPTVFAPGEVVSRAQMATFLWRMAGEPRASACSFEDEEDIPTWARVATCWLQDNGYTTEDPYKPNGAVTRAQMAAFLFRIWGPATYASSCGFSDEGDIPSWAKSATCWMKDNDITTGFGDSGGYAPLKVVSRGQMAAFLYRLGGNIQERWRVIIE